MAISFNGSSSKLELTGISPIITAYPFTIFVWCKPTSLGTSQMVVEHSDTNVNEAARMYCSSSSTARSAVINGGTSATVEANHAPTTGAWNGWAYVATNATSRTAYLADTTGAGTDTVSMTPTFANFNRIMIGASNSGGSNTFFFGGDIAEVHLFSAVISTSDFASLIADSIKPESVSGWVDGWTLETAGSYTSIGGTRTLTATSVSQGGAHPIARGGGGGSNTLAWITA